MFSFYRINPLFCWFLAMKERGEEVTKRNEELRLSTWMAYIEIWWAETAWCKKKKEVADQQARRSIDMGLFYLN